MTKKRKRFAVRLSHGRPKDCRVFCVCHSKSYFLFHRKVHLNLCKNKEEKINKQFFSEKICEPLELWSYGVTELRIYGITELRNYGITELRNYGFTELRNYGITELRIYGITKLRNYGTTDIRNYGYTDIRIYGYTERT